MYSKSSSLTAILYACFSLVSAQQLDKPPLTPDLEYLKPALLDALPSVNMNKDQWGEGWIPQDCKSMTEEKGLNAADVETWNVHYDDVGILFVPPSPPRQFSFTQTNPSPSVRRRLGPLPSSRRPILTRRPCFRLRPPSSPHSAIRPTRHRPT